MDQGGFIGKFIPVEIGIKKLLIWQDGQIEFEGGNIILPKSVTLKAGPAEISVSAMGMGSHEREHEGQLQQYRFFEFSGGISVNPGGVDARGDGIKFHYTTDNDTLTGKNPHRYIQIQGIGIDIIIPGSAAPENAALILKGYLSMKEPKPGNEQAGNEYAGGIDFYLPKLKMGGSAAMRMNPKIPAFIIDTNLELSSPILIGSTGLGIYGFRGLLGQRYVASKTITGLKEDDTWWRYYKAKISPDYKEGVQISKFDNTGGFSMGAGASFATAMDGGRIFSSKLFFLLSMPEVFLLQGQGQILKERIGLDTTEDPPFFAMMAVSKNSIEAAFGVDYKLPEDKKPGSIASVSGMIETGFFFGNSSAWYLNIGKDLPESRRINARILELFDAYFYLMMSSSGIRAGAGAKFNLDKKFGPLRAELRAYLDVEGKISIQPKQYGAAIQLGGKAGLYIFGLGFAISVDTALAAEAPKPFIVTGSLKVCVKVMKKEYCGKFEFTWVKEKDLDTSQIVIMDRNLGAKALNMLTKETFELYTGADSLAAMYPVSPLDDYVIPMDSCIDMEFLKGVCPAQDVKNEFGGNAQGAKYVEYISPKRSKSARIRHEFHLTGINIFIWDGYAWKPYDIYDAATPLSDAPFVTANLNNMKKGFWQYRKPGIHNNLRIMAQSPLDFLSQGLGDLVVEELGVTNENVLCPPELKGMTCVDFDNYGSKDNNADLVKVFPSEKAIANENLIFRIKGKDGAILRYPSLFYNNMLSVNNEDTLEVFFPQEVSSVYMQLKTDAPGVVLRYYKRRQTHNFTPGNLPEAEYINIKNEQKTSLELNDPVIYEDSQNAVDKIIIETQQCDTEPRQLICSVASEQAEDLEVFLKTVLTGTYSFPMNLYPEYNQDFDGIFQGTSLYPEISETGTTLTMERIFKSDYTLQFRIKDNLGFFCNINLNAPTQFNWDNIQNISNIRQNENRNGTNYNFKIDALMPGNITVTLTGKSNYPVAQCFDNCSLSVYSVCYLKMKDAIYNENLPAMADIQAETDLITENFNESVQVIWRPDSYYAIEISTEDRLFEDGSYSIFKKYADSRIFGFKTAGPPGFFHKENAQYKNLLLQDRDAEFKLKNLRYYIDYQKSYPNANGALLGAKPLFCENPELRLFYMKNYVYGFYSDWGEYQDNGEVKADLLTVIYDPAPDTSKAQKEPISVEWNNDNMPGFVKDAVILNNMIQNGNPCVNTEPIKPMGVHSIVEIDKLEPLKLYTAVFKAKYKPGSQAGFLEEDVHSYVFQTSRYDNFQQQINSYILERDENNPAIITKNAVFDVKISIDGAQLATAQDLLNGNLSMDSPMRKEYADDYDKLSCGIFNLKTLNPALTTEFNLITDNQTENILGIIIRNPEPFNDTKIPENIIFNSIQATEGSNILDKKIFSKDKRNIFITNGNMNISAGNYNFQFIYLMWNGKQYNNEDTVYVDLEIG